MAPDLIAQMLDKLVANAVEFAAGGPIEVRLERDNGHAKLTVANDGPLLPDADPQRLFDSMVSVRSGIDTGGTASGTRPLHRAPDRRVPRRACARRESATTGKASSSPRGGERPFRQYGPLIPS